MPESSTKEKVISHLQWLLCLILFLSIVGSYRAVSSISIGLLLILGLANSRRGLVSIFKSGPNALFMLAIVLLFIADLASVLYSENKEEAWNSLRIKSGLILVPLSVYPGLISNKINRRKLLQGFCIIVFIASFYCVLHAMFLFRTSGYATVFFYHQLVSPIHQHAVYFSILVFISLLYLIETAFLKEFPFGRLIQLFLIVYLSCFLCLLSSKLVIVIYGLYLLYVFPTLIKRQVPSRTTMIACSISLLLALTMLISIKNPLSQRFYEIAKGDMQLVQKDHFDKRDYFNGLQFRVLQWRLVPAILDKKHSWWNGVGVGDAQALLNQEYIDRNMYTGDPATGSKGYLIYNTHNQFLETLLQTGISGLLAILIVCFSMIKMAVGQKRRGYSFVIALLLIWLLTESVFETQYGILIFTFFPFFLQKHPPANPFFLSSD